MSPDDRKTINWRPAYKGAVLGFRRWKIDSYNKVLCSVISGKSWHSGTNFADGCDSHSSPGADCACGFNGWYDLHSAESNYSGLLGAFLGAGDVELHNQGFRSSEAQIIALYSSGSIDSDLKEIARRYKVPVFQSKKEFLKFVEKTTGKITPDLEDLKQYASSTNTNSSNSSSNSTSSSPAVAPRSKVTLKVLFTADRYNNLVCSFVITGFLDLLLVLFSSSETFAPYLWVTIVLPVIAIITGICQCLYIDSIYSNTSNLTGHEHRVSIYCAVFLFVLTTLLSLGISNILHNNYVDKTDAQDQAITRQADLAAVAVAEDRYYQINGEYTTDPEALAPRSSLRSFDNKDSSGDFLSLYSNADPDQGLQGDMPIQLELGSDNKSYLATLAARDEDDPEEELAIKGSPKGIATYCEGNILCEDHQLNISKINDKILSSYTSVIGKLPEAPNSKKNIEDKPVEEILQFKSSDKKAVGSIPESPKNIKATLSPECKTKWSEVFSDNWTHANNSSASSIDKKYPYVIDQTCS